MKAIFINERTKELKLLNKKDGLLLKDPFCFYANIQPALLDSKLKVIDKNGVKQKVMFDTKNRIYYLYEQGVIVEAKDISITKKANIKSNIKKKNNPVFTQVLLNSLKEKEFLTGVIERYKSTGKAKNKKQVLMAAFKLLDEKIK